MARKKDPEGAKAQILDAALKLFSEKGYEETTMQNIVDLSGLSKGAIYYHFKDKSEIYRGLYESVCLKPYSCFEELNQDQSLSASEKHERLLNALATSPEKLLYAQAMRDHKNPNLVEMSLRYSILNGSVYIAKLIEEGIQEGIYAPVDAKMIAQLFCLTVDMWLNPCVNEHTTTEEFERKLDVIQKTFELHGVPLVTPAVRRLFLQYWYV